MSMITKDSLLSQGLTIAVSEHTLDPILLLGKDNRETLVTLCHYFSPYL